MKSLKGKQIQRLDVKVQGKLAWFFLQRRKVFINARDVKKVIGIHWWLSERKEKHTNHKTYYVYSSVGLLHRIIMNAPNGKVVDHLNHNGLQNQRKNLRVTTYSKNLLNHRTKRRHANVRKAQSEARKNWFKNPENYQRHKASVKSASNSDKERARRSKSHKKLWKNLEFRRKTSSKIRRSRRTPESRAKSSRAKKLWWSNPKNKATMLARRRSDGRYA